MIHLLTGPIENAINPDLLARPAAPSVCRPGVVLQRFPDPKKSNPDLAVASGGSRDFTATAGFDSGGQPSYIFISLTTKGMKKDMKEKLVAALLLVLASPLLIHAQDQAEAARIAAGCGPSDVRFSVKTDKNQHPLAQPEAGKALVYVFEDERRDMTTRIGPAETARVGLDGKWVGANHGTSYLFFTVDPGEHRVCSNWQSKFEMYSRQGSAMTFTAEAGKAYFFRVELEERQDRRPALKLEQLDGARGAFLVSNHSLSKPHAREVARK